jgi:hypothetical protein
LLEYGDVCLVVSTVGNCFDRESTDTREVGIGRYYETMAFHAAKCGEYWEANVHQQVDIEGKTAVTKARADNEANDMHEAAVKELTKRLIRDTL